MDDRQRWAWASRRDSEEWNGPFDTREEAEEAARRAGDEDEFGFVAPAEYPNAGDVACSVAGDLSDLLEKMDEHAFDNCFYAGDDELFVPVGQHEEAEEALRVALSSWAEKYIRASKFTVDIDKAVPVRSIAEVTA